MTEYQTVSLVIDKNVQSYECKDKKTIDVQTNQSIERFFFIFFQIANKTDDKIDVHGFILFLRQTNEYSNSTHLVRFMGIFYENLFYMWQKYGKKGTIKRGLSKEIESSGRKLKKRSISIVKLIIKNVCKLLWVDKKVALNLPFTLYICIYRCQIHKKPSLRIYFPACLPAYKANVSCWDEKNRNSSGVCQWSNKEEKKKQVLKTHLQSHICITWQQ